MIEKNKFYILTGAPGVGKSSLLMELSKDFNIVKEPAREIIAEQRAIDGNGLWEKDTKLFVNLLLEKSIENFKSANNSVLTYFDRGVPDNIAYAAYGGLDVTNFETASQRYRYNKRVFLLEPWEEIYKTDEERKMPFSEVIKFHQHIVEAYCNLGHELLEVPKLRLEDRAKFIKSHI